MNRSITTVASLVAVLVSFCLAGLGNAQTLSGIVTNADGAGVSNATVFVAGSTIQTTSDSEGKFSIPAPPLAGFEVVAVTGSGMLGVTSINPESIGDIGITVTEKSEQASIETSTLSRSDLEEFFVSTAFSWTKNSGEIEVQNMDKLAFSHDETNNVIRATSDGPFVFTNQELGYQVSVFDFVLGGNQIAYNWSGYALYTPLTSEKSKDEKNWNKARENTYEGSLRHFLKALADERLKKEEFAAYFVQGPGSEADHNPIFEAGITSNRGATQPILFKGKIAPSYRLDFIGWIRIQYYGSGGDSRWERYIDRYWPVSELAQVMKANMNVSYLTLPDYQAVFDPTGTLWPAVMPPMRAMGYWSFFRMADLLPSDWMPNS